MRVELILTRDQDPTRVYGKDKDCQAFLGLYDLDSPSKYTIEEEKRLQLEEGTFVSKTTIKVNEPLEDFARRLAEQHRGVAGRWCEGEDYTGCLSHICSGAVIAPPQYLKWIKTFMEEQTED